MTDGEVDAYRKKALEYILKQLEGDPHIPVKDRAAELILQHCYYHSPLLTNFSKVGATADES